MQRQAVRVLRLSIGALLLLVGFIGGFIPILQGWIFVLAGLTVMAPESRLARSWLDWMKERARGVRARAGRSGAPAGSASARSPRAAAPPGFGSAPEASRATTGNPIVRGAQPGDSVAGNGPATTGHIERKER